MITHFALLPITNWTTDALTGDSIPAETYRLETGPTLESNDWTLVEKRVATGFTETATDPAFGPPVPRLYRVAWVRE